MADQDGEIVVEERSPQPVISTRFECVAAAVGDHFEKMLPPVVAYIEAQDGEITGPPFLRYHALFDDEFFLELGLPVDDHVEARAMMEANELPGGHVVATTHVGPYKSLGKTHRRVRDWIREHDWQPAGPAWDFFLDNPDAIDGDELRTRVFYPVEVTEENEED